MWVQHLNQPKKAIRGGRSVQIQVAIRMSHNLKWMNATPPNKHDICTSKVHIYFRIYIHKDFRVTRTCFISIYIKMVTSEKFLDSGKMHGKVHVLACRDIIYQLETSSWLTPPPKGWIGPQPTMRTRRYSNEWKK